MEKNLWVNALMHRGDAIVYCDLYLYSRDREREREREREETSLRYFRIKYESMIFALGWN